VPKSPPIIASTSTAQTASAPQPTAAAEAPKGPPIIPSTSTAQTPSAPQQTSGKKSSKVNILYIINLFGEIVIKENV
jgi:hypothetical protein